MSEEIIRYKWDWPIWGWRWFRVKYIMDLCIIRFYIFSFTSVHLNSYSPKQHLESPDNHSWILVVICQHLSMAPTNQSRNQACWTLQAGKRGLKESIRKWERVESVEELLGATESDRQKIKRKQWTNSMWGGKRRSEREVTGNRAKDRTWVRSGQSAVDSTTLCSCRGLSTDWLTAQVLGYWCGWRLEIHWSS